MTATGSCMRMCVRFKNTTGSSKMEFKTERKLWIDDSQIENLIDSMMQSFEVDERL